MTVTVTHMWMIVFFVTIDFVPANIPKSSRLTKLYFFVMNRAYRCEYHKLVLWWEGRVVTACKRSCCCHFVQERFSTYFERVLLFDDLSRSSQIVPLGSGRSRRVAAGALCDHLEPTLVEIQARICQACDAGSRSQNGGGQWGGSLDIYGSLSSLQCVECGDYEPVFGGPLFSVRASGAQDPRRLIPSSALHCLFCGSRICWFLELLWQACPQPHFCCCVQLLQVRLGPWSLYISPLNWQTVASRGCLSL